MPVGAEGWARRVRERAGAKDWSALWNSLEPALSASGEAAARLERVRRAGGVVVTTGQQPGLFGGPIYTWTKAAGALALADAIQAATGVPTAAVFWAATDDADFLEASSTVLARTGGVEVLRHESAPPAGTPMSLAPLGDESALLARLAEACGSGADHRALSAARRAYSRDGATVGSAYVELLRGLLAPLGIPVLDASHPAVQTVSAPTLRLALDRATDIESALTARSAEIRAAGYSPQVEDMAGLSLVFGREGTVKRRIGVNERGVRAGVLTPNVLLRPIVEHEILPTVAYCAGPGELAYFAQVSAVAEAMHLAAPMAVPRWSCTLLEPHVDTVMRRLGLQLDDLKDPHAPERRLATRAMSERTTAGLKAIRDAIAALPESLGDEPAELRLDAPVLGAVRALEHRVDRLQRRLVAGVARRETALMRDLATARAALYPLGERQERTLNIIPILARHGLELLAELHEAAGAHATSIVGVRTSDVQPAAAPVA
jgi:uncharacterized protein YllA (UPF0747 family)